MTAKAASPGPRPPGRPRKPPVEPERSLLATTIRHVDDDGNVTRLTFFDLQLLIKQRRGVEARMERERRAEVLRMVREDRAAMASFLAEEREAERAIAKLWVRMRVRVREPRKEPEREGRRFTREIRRSRPRRLPTYSKDIIDAFGRRGIYYRARYVSGRKGASYVGCAKAVWRYFIREGAFEHDAVGVPSVISNMGADALEVGAACDLLESVQRAERANAKLFTVIEANLPHDLSPEARVTALYRFCEEAFGAFDLPYAAAVHHPPEGGDQRNTHAHIMVWWRPVIRIAPYEWQVAKDLATEHDSTEMTMSQREQFAEAMTWASHAEGRRRVYTGFSHAQRGLAIKPTAKIGKNLTELHRRGERVALIERNAMTISSNEAILDADRLRTSIAEIEAIRRDLDALQRLRAAPVAETSLTATAAIRTARIIEPITILPAPVRANAVGETPSLSTGLQRARSIQRGDLPAIPKSVPALVPDAVAMPHTVGRSALIKHVTPAVIPAPMRAGEAVIPHTVVPSQSLTKESGSGRTTNAATPGRPARRQTEATVVKPSSAKPEIPKPFVIDHARHRRLLAMAGLQASFGEQRISSDAEPDWNPYLGLPAALPDHPPSLSSRGTRGADGSMTIDGLSVILGDPPTSASGGGAAAPGRAAFAPVGPDPCLLTVRALPVAGQAVAPRVARAAPVGCGPAMMPQKVSPLVGPTIARVPTKVTRVRYVPALPPLHRMRKITSYALQPLPIRVATVRNLPVRDHGWPVARATALAPGPTLMPDSPRAKPVRGTALPMPVRSTALVPGGLSPLWSAFLKRAKPVRSFPPPVTVSAAKPVDQLYDVLSFLARLRRERQARERERREAEAARKAPAAAAIPSSVYQNAERVVRLETHDPADPDRLSAILLDHLADVALRPEWLQIEGNRIRHVGGSRLFNERWQAWRGNQEVLRLVLKVHRRATGGSDDLPPAIQLQVDEAITERTRSTAGGRPSVIDPGRDDNGR